jgi:glycosyltransferase involved in cell wall biosynthesis
MLHIIGEGPEKIILQEEASNLGIESRVVFYGHVEAEKLGMLYTLCNCVLLTSVQESIPTVILEAHTAKIPIIATDVGSAGEIIQDGENGLLIVPNDLTSLQNVMERIMTEENLEHRLRLKAELYMKNYWTLDQILAGYKQSWQKALANRL